MLSREFFRSRQQQAIPDGILRDVNLYSIERGDRWGQPVQTVGICRQISDSEVQSDAASEQIMMEIVVVDTDLKGKIPQRGDIFEILGNDPEALNAEFYSVETIGVSLMGTRYVFGCVATSNPVTSLQPDDM